MTKEEHLNSSVLNQKDETSEKEQLKRKIIEKLTSKYNSDVKNMQHLLQTSLDELDAIKRQLKTNGNNSSGNANNLTIREVLKAEATGPVARSV
ncbi:uncharacterized protein SCDLUD_004382 [Saccharomycodes ludwigii]|uniref:uncharacterized protein n=1 Tax=Saccharomycodes ludwigii TaxID=36035 RepID=UPI001E8A7DA5|nr:hypothetical protein SCDLUD_004382 [Saccharomycodes ludwigii]KAH3900063.1 hypothetical protein SCDLUD_004382 [Saccharomycodes ludwigii]